MDFTAFGSAVVMVWSGGPILWSPNLQFSSPKMVNAQSDPCLLVNSVFILKTLPKDLGRKEERNPGSIDKFLFQNKKIAIFSEVRSREFHDVFSL
jgi:hypothetical protein